MPASITSKCDVFIISFSSLNPRVDVGLERKTGVRIEDIRDAPVLVQMNFFGGIACEVFCLHQPHCLVGYFLPAVNLREFIAIFAYPSR
jgi:hypothetical protein